MRGRSVFEELDMSAAPARRRRRVLASARRRRTKRAARRRDMYKPVYRHSTDRTASELRSLSRVCHRGERTAQVKAYSKGIATSNLLRHLKDAHGVEDTQRSQPSSITQFFSPRTPTTSSSSKRSSNKWSLSRDLALWFARSLIPFDSVENDAMIDFLKKYNIIVSADDLPSRHNIAREGLEDVYNNAGGNMKRAANLLGFDNHLCLGHALHNLVNVDGIANTREISKLLKKCKKIVKHVRYRAPRVEAAASAAQNDLLSFIEEFAEHVEDEDSDSTDSESESTEIPERALSSRKHLQPPPTIKTSTSTRWHSVLMMLKSISNSANRQPINTVLNEIGRGSLVIQDIDYENIEALIKFLENFKKIVEILSSETQPTINLALVFRSEIKRLLEEMGDDEPLVIRRLKNNMLAGLESRFPLTDVVVAATLLDCRFHGINEIEEFMKTKGTTKVSFLASMVRSRLMTEDIPQNKITDSAGEVGTSSSVNAANFLLDLARKHSATQQDAESAVENECWTYFATASPEHLQPYGGDVLQYWRDKKTCMPSLYALARSILNIPATSTPSERVFSTAGLMLSPREDDDDDSHLCIKCNTTIVGLDNYVKHRKQRCGKLKPEDPKPELPAIDTLEPSYSLGADVFFQSLELQSSVKKTSLSRLTPPIPISKASIDRKTSLAVPSTSRDIPRMSPLENNLRGEDWIGGHSLRIGSNEDNQTKLINAVASISGASQVKKDIPTSSYSINYDYKADEESDESEESEDDEEEDHPTGAKWKPPPNYTGGKWRPASPDHEDWDMREEQEHTGGKWKPIMPDNNERDEDYDAPPPGHTKGKWIPGANEKTQIMQTTIQNKGSVQYWCGPCNRRLNSRAIYDKHLRSSLHLKKVLPEHELEFSGHLEPMKPVMDKRLTRPSRFINDDIYSQMEKKRHGKAETKINIKIQKKKRKRKITFVHCSGCKSRVRQHLMGKHLISHYHFRKATDTNTVTYQQLILDNMDAIVHQSPFQCSPCKFYTNWLSTFMQHWFSEEHEQKLASIEGRLWCSFCKFDCESSQEMLQHLSSSDHSEVVAVINRSMPIIIRKKTLFKCDACSKEFRYNIEMKRHCQKTGHPLAITATDNYQELHKCQHCKAKFKSSLTLAAHLKSKHEQRAYLCLVCDMNFKSSDEAKRHRQTSEHRIKRKENLREQGLPTKDMTKKCPYCTDNVILRNILVLKEHIRRVHPNIRKKCPKCGMSFILSQEVTRHVRDNACQLSQTAQITSSIFWNCSQCLFTTDSQAEYQHYPVTQVAVPVGLRHVTVPMTSVHMWPRIPVNWLDGVAIGNYGFRHRRSHGERIKHHECHLCTFKSDQASHMKRHMLCHQGVKPYACPHCSFTCGSLENLRKHVLRSGRHQGLFLYHCRLCPYNTNTATELRAHLTTAHSNKYNAKSAIEAVKMHLIVEDTNQ
ncbi:unnamed protein product [Spodoptera exigua]|nr:unnamed protein product [Spodoptera exigua]